MDRKEQRNVNRPHRTAERRKRTDWVVRSVSIISVIGWVLVLAALFMLDRASPPQENLFTRLFQVQVNSAWNTSLLTVSLFILIGVFIISVVGFLFNMMRHRRKTDKYSKAIIIAALVSLIGIAFMLYIFVGMA